MLVSDKVRNCFFGDLPIGSSAVITPVERIYRQLLEGNSYKTAAGWYKTAFLPDLDTTVVKTHQGRSVIDVLHALQTKRTLHVGYCGSNNYDFPVGGVVFGSTASHVREPGDYPCGPEYTISEKFGKVRSVDSILLDEGNPADSDFFDMESYWVYRFSERPLSIMLVTDSPIVEPFYDVRLGDLRVEYGFRKLISTARNMMEATLWLSE